MQHARSNIFHFSWLENNAKAFRGNEEDATVWFGWVYLTRNAENKSRDENKTTSQQSSTATRIAPGIQMGWNGIGQGIGLGGPSWRTRLTFSLSVFMDL